MINAMMPAHGSQIFRCSCMLHAEQSMQRTATAPGRLHMQGTHPHASANTTMHVHNTRRHMRMLGRGGNFWWRLLQPWLGHTNR